MCGIAGIIGPQADVGTVERMTQRLRHRGPDGEGVWSGPGAVLGHRRLAIIDLSEAGRQPMVLGPHVLTYNGELYNHQQLRTGLPGPWRSTSDTEVLLHLIAHRGMRALGELVGMFAFASWDSGERRLMLVRDRLGIKPLYYRLLPDGIAFASELKALLLLGRPDIDRSAVRDFLSTAMFRRRRASTAASRNCRPATRSSGRMGGRSSSATGTRRPISPSEAPATPCSDLDALLREIVPAHTLSDVPVGVFLSGGMDSALTTYYLDAPRTYSLGFDARDRSELDAARSAAPPSRHRAHGDDRAGGGFRAGARRPCRRCSTSRSATARHGPII